MKRSVYVETTVVSYLAGRPSRDLVQSAHQQITWQWWESRRHDFRLYVSQMVIREASAGDPGAAARRLALLRALPLLEVTEEAIDLAESLVGPGPMPAKAADDAFHLAIATVHQVDYLLTWNFRHLANAEMSEQLKSFLAVRGYDGPTICTPEELLGEQP